MDTSCCPSIVGKATLGVVKEGDVTISPVNVNGTLSDLFQALKGEDSCAIAQKIAFKSEILNFWVKNIGKIRPEMAKSAEFRKRFVHCEAISAWNFMKFLYI